MFVKSLESAVCRNEKRLVLVNRNVLLLSSHGSNLVPQMGQMPVKFRLRLDNKDLSETLSSLTVTLPVPL